MGANLIRNSGNFKNLNGWVQNGGTATGQTQILEVVTKDGYKCIHANCSIAAVNDDTYIPSLLYGEFYIVSCWIKTTNPINDVAVIRPLHYWASTIMPTDPQNALQSPYASRCFYGSTPTIPANTWTRIAVKIKCTKPPDVTDEYYYLRPFIYNGTNTGDDLGEYWVRDFQLEMGETLTDWEPHPLDDPKYEDGNANLLRNSDFRDNVKLPSENPTLYEHTSLLNWSTYNRGIANPLTNYHAHVDLKTFGYPVVEFNETNGSRNWKAITTIVRAIKGCKKPIWFSFDYFAAGSGTKLFGGIYYRKFNGDTTLDFHSGQYDTSYLPNLYRWTRFSILVPFKDDCETDDISFYIYGYNFSSNSILYIKNVKLEIGDEPTPWRPNREDNNISDINFTPSIVASDQTTLSKILEKAISTWTDKYLLTSASSGVTTSTTGWSNVIQNPTAEKRYVWNYEQLTFSNGDSQNTTPRIVAVYGEKGLKGDTGVGISGITNFFASHYSGDSPPTSGWTNTVPKLDSVNRYLWHYDKIAYTNNTTSETTKTLISVYYPPVSSYTVKIESSTGTTFKNKAISGTLTAKVFQNGRQLSSAEILKNGCIKWYKDGASTNCGMGETLVIGAGSITAAEVSYTAKYEA